MQPSEIVFQSFYQSSLQLISKRISYQDRKELLEGLVAYINKFKVELEVKRFFMNVIYEKEQEQHKVIKDVVFHYVVQYYYESCCEYIGSVETDKIFSYAIKKAGELPEAMEFDPTQLLK